MLRVTVSLLLLLVAGVCLTLGIVGAQGGGPPPAPAPGSWSVTVPGDTEDTLVTDVAEDSTYRITSGSESAWPVTVVKLNSAGNEIPGSGVTLEPGDSYDCGIPKKGGIKVRRIGLPAGTAGGTYQKV
jgi:hypothetical protein